MPLLNVSNLNATIEDKPILNGVTLNVKEGETVALMGPNGSGKSTLAAVLMGHPGYSVTGGVATYRRQDLLVLKPEERAKAGLFLSWQYPQEVAGVTMGNFLRLAYNATHEQKISVSDFLNLLKKKLDILKMPHDFISRSVNEGFSGGEKKRAELLQLAVLEPKLAILDEIDSGLDIDALKLVAEVLKTIKQEEPTLSLLVITHYQRLLEHLPPDRLYIMRQGKIVAEGNMEILKQVEAKGYQDIK